MYLAPPIHHFWGHRQTTKCSVDVESPSIQHVRRRSVFTTCTYAHSWTGRSRVIVLSFFLAAAASQIRFGVIFANGMQRIGESATKLPIFIAIIRLHSDLSAIKVSQRSGYSRVKWHVVVVQSEVNKCTGLSGCLGFKSIIASTTPRAGLASLAEFRKAATTQITIVVAAWDEYLSGSWSPCSLFKFLAILSVGSRSFCLSAVCLTDQTTVSLHLARADDGEWCGWPLLVCVLIESEREKLRELNFSQRERNEVGEPIEAAEAEVKLLVLNFKSESSALQNGEEGS